MRNKLLLIMSLVVLAVSVAIAQLDIKYEKYTLPNGLQVILHQDHSVPIIAVNIRYHVGASREKKGKSGFAHLFEHLMYEGSQNVRDGLYDEIIDGAGGSNNASTGFDQTNYWLVVPKNYIEPALWLESDRMGFLLPAITQERLDLQRDVVKNERRQDYEDQPYGMAFKTILENLYPEGVPYNWLPIGTQEDLSAASLEDVKEFFRTYYSTRNASLCIGGDFELEEMKQLVSKYFSDVPEGPVVQKLKPIKHKLKETKYLLLEDAVQLPRLYLVWHSPHRYHADDAGMDILSEVLTGGKNSRLYKSLVYEKQIAQHVTSLQGSLELSGYFAIIATAKPGVGLSEVHSAIMAELDNIVKQGVLEREIERAKNGIRANFIYGLQNIGGFGGKTDQLNAYNIMLNEPGMFNWDLQRYVKVKSADMKNLVNTYLKKNHIVLSVVPLGKTELQVKR